MKKIVLILALSYLCNMQSNESNLIKNTYLMPSEDMKLGYVSSLLYGSEIPSKVLAFYMILFKIFSESQSNKKVYDSSLGVYKYIKGCFSSYDDYISLKNDYNSAGPYTKSYLWIKKNFLYRKGSEIERYILYLDDKYSVNIKNILINEKERTAFMNFIIHTDISEVLSNVANTLSKDNDLYVDVLKNILSDLNEMNNTEKVAFIVSAFGFSTLLMSLILKDYKKYKKDNPDGIWEVYFVNSFVELLLRVGVSLSCLYNLTFNYDSLWKRQLSRNF